MRDVLESPTKLRENKIMKRVLMDEENSWVYYYWGCGKGKLSVAKSKNEIKMCLRYKECFLEEISV